MSARWHCKVCRSYGLGGPEGAVKHMNAEHRDGNRYGAQVSFGFAPNYSNGYERKYDRIMPGPVALREVQP